MKLWHGMTGAIALTLSVLVLWGHRPAADAGHVAAQEPALGAVPVGTIVPFAGVYSEALRRRGWLFCTGQSILRKDWPELFGAIGTAWGKGNDPGDQQRDGTTFNVPDLRGRFVRGVDGGTKRDPDAHTRSASGPGGNKGAAIGSLQDDATRAPRTPFVTGAESVKHTHDLSPRAWTDGGESKLKSGGSYSNRGTPRTTHNRESHSHVVIGGGDTETRPKNVSVSWVIRAR